MAADHHLYRATERDERLVVARDTLVIDDPGRLLPELAATLSCPDERVAAATVVEGTVIRILVREDPDAPERHLITVDGLGAARTTQVAGPAIGATEVLGLLTRAWLDSGELAPRVHAGCVVDDAGQAIVALGASGQGKSTLVAHMVTRGLRLMTDEMVALVPRHERVASFSRPIAVKAGGGTHAPSATGPPRSEPHLITLEQLDGRQALTGRPALVVVLDRQASGPTTWSSLAPVEAVMELCHHNLDLVREPVAGMGAFGWLASRSTAIRLSYSSAEDASAILAELVATRATADQDRPAPRVSRAADRPPDDASSPIPVPGVVTVWMDDEAVAFRPDTLQVAWFNRDMAARWDRLATGTDAADVRDGVVGELARAGFLAEGSEAAVAPPAPRNRRPWIRRSFERRAT